MQIQCCALILTAPHVSNAALIFDKILHIVASISFQEHFFFLLPPIFLDRIFNELFLY